jgi:integrase
MGVMRMAWTQERAGSFRVIFRYQAKEHAFTLGRVSAAEAANRVGHVDLLLMRLKDRLIELPAGVDILSFVKAGGTIEQAVKTANRRVTTTLGALRDRYLATHEGAHESKTLYTTKIHFKHLIATLGEGFPLSELTHAALQRHIGRRAEKKISPTTIKKEISTLRAAWNWGKWTELVSGDWPGQRLVYKKTSEKPPFQTRAEIERQIAAGGLTAKQRNALWRALYLQAGSELEEALKIVRANAAHAWIYPMVCTAAYTGARRSELIRMQPTDVDFKANVVIIREKKRVPGKLTTRRVPLTTALASVLKEYLATHDGGPHLFCHAGPVERSRTRSKTTGYKDMKSRPSGGKARQASVRERETPPQESLSPTEAHDHLKRTLANSKWEVITGWHIFRHSFISACASKGIDDRLIRSWSGHMSAEMSARYTHLYPSVAKTALDSVFD